MAARLGCSKYLRQCSLAGLSRSPLACQCSGPKAQTHDSHMNPIDEAGAALSFAVVAHGTGRKALAQAASQVHDAGEVAVVKKYRHLRGGGGVKGLSQLSPFLRPRPTARALAVES